MAAEKTCVELLRCGDQAWKAMELKGYRLLLRTKQTFREKDAEDRMFLEARIAREAK